MTKPASQLTGGELQIIRDAEDRKLLKGILNLFDECHDQLEEDVRLEEEYEREEKHGQRG